MTQNCFLFKGLALLLLYATSFSYAQTINTTYKTEINAKFAGLDKSKIPTKLLINQAIEFAELSDYSGSFTSTNFTTKGKYTGIYNTLLMSRTQSSVTGLISPTAFKNNWDNLRQANKIVLSGLYYKYNKFKPDAYPNFLVNNNGVITDKYVNSVWQNPYIDQQVFAIALPILLYKSLSLQVTLPASLWYTNQTSTVQSIAIDFNDGLGYQSMTLGQVRTINYANPGIYEWKYKLTLTDSQILYSHSKLQIELPTLSSSESSTLQLSNGTVTTQAGPGGPQPEDCSILKNIAFTGTRQYLGVANSATLQIKYNTNNNCKIKNPLIVVEGFDSGLLGVENAFGENDYFTFSRSTIRSFSSELSSSLNTFDIIYINFNQGRDDLKRNAYLVEDIIKWVNAQKVLANSTTPNVVIGQSMGGVIARYALRDMEVLGQPHQTRLFVSHDAPQQGANIPLGIQYFARHMANQFIDTPVGDYQISVGGNSNISISDIQNLLDAPGTKQLLANSIDSGFNLNNSSFNAFQTELRNLGYPVQTRNIALSNGNHCANTQEFNPSTTLFSLSGNASTTALTTLLTVLIEPLTGITSLPLAYEFNEPGLLIGMLPGSSNFAMNFSANALPSAGSSNQVYHGNMTYTKKIFSLFGWDPQITVSLTDRSYNNPVPLSYDYYPGGKYQLPFNFETPDNPLEDWITIGINVYVAPSFDFIPVPSALDIGGGAATLNNADYLMKYNASTPPVKGTPFTNFTTSFPNNANVNEPHISFNTRNGNWLAKELDVDATNNEIFNCSFKCADTQISGASLICTPSTYTVAGGTATSFYWTVSQGSSLVTYTGANTSSIILTPIANASGEVILSLTMGNQQCGNVTLTKSIQIGKPDFKITGLYLTQQPGIIRVKMESNNSISLASQGISSTTWNAVTSTGSTVNCGTSLFTGTVSVNYQTITVTATNPCGTSVVTADVIDLQNGSVGRNTYKSQNDNDTKSGIKVIYKTYPNPSSGILNIELKDTSLVPATDGAITASLFNMMGEIKGSVQIINNSASISTVGLPKGIYILKINSVGNFESHQIAVQ